MKKGNGTDSYKNPGFRTRNLPRGRRTLSRLSYGGCFDTTENKLYIAKQLQFSTAKKLSNVRMEGQRVQYRLKRIISILFLFLSIFLFMFVLTSQFYRDLENTFQSIMYND